MYELLHDNLKGKNQALFDANCPVSLNCTFFQILVHCDVYMHTLVIYDLWTNFILQSCILAVFFIKIKFLLYCCWNLSGWIHPKKNCRNDFWYAWLTPPTSVSTFLRPKNGQAEWWLVLNGKIEFSCLFKTFWMYVDHGWFATQMI